MSDAWPTQRLADVAEVNPREPKPDPTAPFVPMDAVNPATGGIDYFDVVGARGGARFRGGDVLMARITPCLENGKVALVPSTTPLAGGSTEFVVLRPRRELVLPEFLHLLTTWERVHDEAVSLMVGTSGRQRVAAADIASIAVPVPSMDEQRAIVALVEAIDAVRQDARNAQAANELAARSVIADAISGARGNMRRIDGLLSVVIGGAWGDPPGTPGTVPVTALGPSAFSNDSVRVAPEAGSARGMGATRLEKRALQKFDIILERSGGTDTQPVGRVIYAPQDLPEVVPSDFMRLLRVDPGLASPLFVFWSLWCRYHGGDTLRFQSQTTNIRNLRIPDYLASEMLLPSRPQQEAIATLAESLYEQRLALAATASAADGLRKRVVSELLSGLRRLPAIANDCPTP